MLHCLCSLPATSVAFILHTDLHPPADTLALAAVSRCVVSVERSSEVAKGVGIALGVARGRRILCRAHLLRRRDNGAGAHTAFLAGAHSRPPTRPSPPLLSDGRRIPPCHWVCYHLVMGVCCVSCRDCRHQVTAAGGGDVAKHGGRGMWGLGCRHTQY
jgi:hypothetical protein